ncbi:hypothetical protein M413DRAFT_447011 [Hebeloma cylindrosporum]|uniref:J domain-containing protein n=1 Tax=Hebeloma cylindrosporum TaxID=76867 RepID=A0A0C3BS40_HEBCY|nr:hypothetical protein M413DRAFT_447011 [Hebeloma cylindrosporum h7]
MTLLYSHGRHFPTPCFSIKLKVHVSASRVSCCRYPGRIRQRRYATIVADDIAPDKPIPPLKNPFPYPSNAKPTPHQIFHLPFNATQAQIKARYYELVHAHHPDSQYAAHLPWDVAQHRFRSIKASYDYLSGRSVSPDPNSRPTPSPKNFDPYVHEMARRRRAYYASQARDPGMMDNDGWAKPGWGEGFGAPKSERSEWNGEGWRERMLLSLGVVTLMAGLFPTMPTTVANAFLPTSYDAVDPSLSYSASQPNTNTSPSSAHRDSTNTNSSSSSTKFSFPFSLDFDKRHREAVSALVQARCDREEMGVERREGLKKRVKEMEMARSGGGGGAHAEYGCGPHPPIKTEGRGTTRLAAVPEDSVVRSSPLEAHEDADSSSDAGSTLDASPPQSK